MTLGRLTRRAILTAVATAVWPGASRADLAEVRSRGKLIVGTSGSFPPFTAIAPDGSNVGFDIDYLTAVAKLLGVTAEFVTLEGAGVFPGLLAGKFDTACAAYVITEERVKAVDFPEPHAYGGTVMLVRASDTAFQSYADLKDRRIGVILGSVDERRLRSVMPGWKELKTYPGWSEEWIDLMAGRVDGLSTQFAVAINALRHERDAARARIAGEPVFKGVIGFPVRKDDKALRAAMSDAIHTLKANGTLAALSQKWLGATLTAAETDAVWAEQGYIGR
jgi:ABC-type amino acid transport substrate-binding protein